MSSGLLHHSGDRIRSHLLLLSSLLRSPEILLGLPFSHGIDMWGCGCVLGFLYLHNHLFKVDSTYAMVGYLTPEPCPQPSSMWFLTAVHALYLQMRQIVQLLGQPEDHLLCAGKYTREYFMQVEASEGPAWRLKVGLSSDFVSEMIVIFFILFI